MDSTMSFPHQFDRPDERFVELAEIMAAGLQRVMARQSSQNLASAGESSLHILPDQSGDAAEKNGGEPA
jgi:hypothetical protein